LYSDENRVAIGVLVTPFCEGSPRGKLDATKALFNLCLSQKNKGWTKVGLFSIFVYIKKNDILTHIF